MQEPPQEPTPQPAAAPPPSAEAPLAPAPEPELSPAWRKTPEEEALVEANRKQLTTMIVVVICVSCIGLFLATAFGSKVAPKPDTPVVPTTVGAPATTATAPAAVEHPSKDVVDSLARKAQEKGTINLVVGIHINRPPGSLSAEQLQTLEKELATTEDNVTSRAFGTPTTDNAKRQGTMPEMRMTVTSDQVQKLGADADVTSLREE
jgi:hypothetical protein